MKILGVIDESKYKVGYIPKHTFENTIKYIKKSSTTVSIRNTKTKHVAPRIYRKNLKTHMIAALYEFSTDWTT